MLEKFEKFDISLARAFFWFAFIAGYWGLVFYAWWGTRHRLYVWAGMFRRLMSSRSFSTLTQNMGALEAEAWAQIAESGAPPLLFMLVPLIITVVLFVAPFIMRWEYDLPVKGLFLLPLATLLCYCFAALFTLVIGAVLSGFVYWLLARHPGPDFFVFLVHPLYLIYPIFQSTAGFLSQCLYLLFIGSVLTIPVDEVEIAEIPALGDPVFREDSILPQAMDGNVILEESEDWDRSACIMEMDRLSRMISETFGQASLVHALRGDLADYIHNGGHIGEEVLRGKPHYQIILFEAVRSLQKILSAEGDKRGAHGVLLFIVDEIEKMGYVSAREAAVVREHLLGLSRKEAAVSRGN